MQVKTNHVDRIRPFTIHDDVPVVNNTDDKVDSLHYFIDTSDGTLGRNNEDYKDFVLVRPN